MTPEKIAVARRIAERYPMGGLINEILDEVERLQREINHFAYVADKAAADRDRYHAEADRLRTIAEAAENTVAIHGFLACPELDAALKAWQERK